MGTGESFPFHMTSTVQMNEDSFILSLLSCIQNVEQEQKEDEISELQ